MYTPDRSDQALRQSEGQQRVTYLDRDAFSVPFVDKPSEVVLQNRGAP